MKRIATLLAALTLTACGSDSNGYTPTAASSPSTDIFLGKLLLTGDSIAVDRLVNITHRDGYDNQPHFTPDGATLLFTSARDTLQTDIYRYDLQTGETTRLTHTTASEYSPTVMPDGAHFSTIREELSRQQLWRYGLDGSDAGGLLEAVQPVGYHAWGDAKTVAMFVLGDSLRPITLQIADIESGEVSIAAENIGRSLHRIPERRAISFVHKIAEDEWLIKALDLKSRTISTVTRTLAGREDYVWLPDGSILMGDESTLHRWSADGWKVVADLAGFGVRGITRLAVSSDGDRIAVVGRRGE